MKDSLALQSLKFINKYSKDKAYKITDINKRNLSSQVRKLHPWFITGFVDGEGNFSVSICKDNQYKTGWRLELVFQIVLHKKDIDLLERIKNYFGVGVIHHQGSRIQYRVQAIKNFSVVFTHFDNYPLITKKRADYLLFNQVFNLINSKQHLTIEGLRKILAIKYSINLGLLSDKLKAAFPNITPVDRPSVLDCKIKNPNWLAGFTSAEGSFMINILNSPSNRIGFQVTMVVQLTQHARDQILMESLLRYLDCGKVYKYKDAFIYKVYNISDLAEKILPFLKKYPIEGIKSCDFEDFCKVAELIKNKAHLSEKGLKEIQNIKANMNRSRLIILKSDITTDLFSGIIKLIKLYFGLIMPSTSTPFDTHLPQFRISRHERDLTVLNRIIQSMGCGNIVKPSSDRDRYNISVGNISDLVNIIIPLFENNPIYGAKHKDFLDFCKGIYIIKSKGHLTPEGLKKNWKI